MEPFIDRHEAPLHFLESVDSTNEWAKRNINPAAFGEGTVYQAGFQTAGRGQLARTWQSPAGQNALFTVVLSPEWLPLQDYAFLNFTVSLACLQVCADYLPGKSVYLKWPNDVVVDDKKLAGILIENIVIANHRFSLVGLGINVNQARFPESLHNAASIYQLGGVRVSVSELVARFRSALMKGYGQLMTGLERRSLLEKYICNMYRLHDHLSYIKDGNRYSGRLTGVDELGRITLFSNGQNQAYRHGEIQILWTL